jgi:hypothetical protein
MIWRIAEFRLGGKVFKAEIVIEDLWLFCQQYGWEFIRWVDEP